MYYGLWMGDKNKETTEFISFNMCVKTMKVYNISCVSNVVSLAGSVPSITIYYVYVYVQFNIHFTGT